MTQETRPPQNRPAVRLASVNGHLVVEPRVVDETPSGTTEAIAGALLKDALASFEGACELYFPLQLYQAAERDDPSGHR